ncbi:MAG: hypothetical protein K6F52_00175 [Clostridia bacterium]|nr:hypothetical protein [Clostridia bacterium]
MLNAYKGISLLETVFLRFGCTEFSELRRLSAEKKMQIAEEIEEKTDEKDIMLQDYNELLHIILGEPPEEDVQTARKRLLEGLRA